MQVHLHDFQNNQVPNKLGILGAFAMVLPMLVGPTDNFDLPVRFVEASIAWG